MGTNKSPFEDFCIVKKKKKKKNKAYFKRFQVKYRRRRQGKTDYSRRRTLVKQDKTKYNSPKYRFVVRFTNKDIVAQIVYAKIGGDFTLASAYAHELPRFGLKNGLTNYAAAYCVGLLLARRLLTKLNLADKYEGTTEVNGEDYYVEALDDGPAPFYALLDVGLRRTTTGAKVLDADTFRKYLFGGHVADYMRELADSNEEKYKKQFAKYIADGVTADSMEELYSSVHAAIRADPTPGKKKERGKDFKHTVRANKKKMSYKQRKDRQRVKVEKLRRKGQL